MTRRIRSGVLVVAVAGALALSTLPTRASHAPLSHVKGRYPTHGFLWLDDLEFNPATLWVYSDRCKATEASAWSKVKAGLKGGSYEFRGAWPGGIQFHPYACSSTVTNYTYIMLDYMTASQWTGAGHGSYGGHHHYTFAPSSWCAMWGVPHPCGYHISRVHINEPRFETYSTNYKINFLLHETGHSMGFNDYCAHPSIANNGASCTMTTGYLSVDRKMIRDVIYKYSPVYRR